MIEIYAVGKKHEPWVQPGIELYSKRLRQPYDAKWQLVPASGQSGTSARQDESERLLRQLGDKPFVILLDERGQQLSSEQLADQLNDQLSYGTPVTIIIGGAYGVDDKLHERADLVWSLSPLVFPHQLVRLILIEQLYRAQQITINSGYHHP